jgi:hypothetical protein
MTNSVNKNELVHMIQSWFYKFTGMSWDSTNQDQRNMKWWIYRFTMKKRRIELVKMGRQYGESNKNWGFHHVSPDKVHGIPFHSHKSCTSNIKYGASRMWEFSNQTCGLTG